MTYGLAVTKKTTLGLGKIYQLLEIGHTGKVHNQTADGINACIYGENMVINGLILIARQDIHVSLYAEGGNGMQNIINSKKTHILFPR